MLTQLTLIPLTIRHHSMTYQEALLSITYLIATPIKN